MTTQPGSHSVLSTPLPATVARSRIRRRWFLAGIGIVALIGLAGWLGPGRQNALGFDELVRGRQVTVAALFDVDAAARPLVTDPQPDASAVREVENHRRIQAALVSSPRVLQEALDQPGVRDLSILQGRQDPVAWLMQHLKVDFDAGPNLMRVSLSGSDSKELLRLMGAVAKVYVRASEDTDRHAQERQATMLNDLIQKLTEQLRIGQLHLNMIRPTSGKEARSDVAVQIAENDLRDIQRQLRRVELARAEATIRLKSQQTLMVRTKQATPSVDRLKEELAVLSSQEKLLQDERRARLVELQSRTTTAISPEVEQLQDEISDRRQALRRLARQRWAAEWTMHALPRVRLFSEPYIVPAT